MRYADGHKDETHRRILDVAATLFHKNGIASVGLATIMKEAGLTNGAFYAHFSSKEALVSEVLGDILDQKEIQLLEALKSDSSLHKYICEYLSPQHRDERENGCPTAALLSELVHHSKSTRKIFTEKSAKFLEHVGSQLKGDEGRRSKLAISVYSLMVGALQLSRAVTDKKLSEQILKSASETATSLISTSSR